MDRVFPGPRRSSVSLGCELTRFSTWSVFALPGERLASPSAIETAHAITPAVTIEARTAESPVAAKTL